MTEFYCGKPSKTLRQWCIQKYGKKVPDPLCFHDNGTNDSAYLQLYAFDSSDRPRNIFCHVQYSMDEMETWNTYKSYVQVKFKDAIGRRIYLRADTENPNGSFYDTSNYSRHQINTSNAVDVECTGDILSIVNSTVFVKKVANSCFRGLFKYCYGLTNIPDIAIEELGNDACKDMFLGCSDIIVAPRLYSVKLGTSCYSNMFYGCSGISEVHMRKVEDMETPYNPSVHGSLGSSGIQVAYDL